MLFPRLLASRRLPLRDAVEKRPPPDEAFDLELDLPDNYNVHKNAISIPVSEEGKYGFLQSYITPQGYVSSQSLLSSPQQQTKYKSLLHLQSVVAAMQAKHGYEAVVPYGALRTGRKYQHNPFLNQKNSDKNSGVLGEFPVT